jgi:hypothetical protein
MRNFSLLIVGLACLTSAAIAAPNQMGTDTNDGVQAYNLKLGLGWAQENQSAYRAHMIQGSFEFMATDRLGLRGNSGIPISTEVKDMKFYPLSMGMAIHILPRHWFDVFVGADAGFVHIGAVNPNLPASWSTRITPVVGVTVYFWGVFYLEGEAGYSILQYAKDTAVDMSSPTFRVRMGFYI